MDTPHKAHQNGVIQARGGSRYDYKDLIERVRVCGAPTILFEGDRRGGACGEPRHAEPLKPSGQFVMADLVKIGGTVPLMKLLLNAGLLDGDCMTVTGKTLAQNLRGAKPYPKGHVVVIRYEGPRGGPGMREMLSPSLFSSISVFVVQASACSPHRLRP